MSTRLLCGLALLCGTLLAGCAQRQPTADPLFANTEAHLVTETLNVQAARGVRADATLYPPHFAGAALSGLGRDKLVRMLRDNDAPLPLVVYLDLPAGDVHKADRREAVRSGLAELGLTAKQFEIVSGPNPQTLHPIAPELARMAKSEPTQPASPFPDTAGEAARTIGQALGK